MATDSTAESNVLIILVNPVEGRDEEFRTWYWETHIPEVLELPAFVSAERFRVPVEAVGSASHRYGTIYTVKGSATEAQAQMFGAGLGTSPDLDLTSMVLVPFHAAGHDA